MDGMPWYKTPIALMTSFVLVGLLLTVFKAPKFICLTAFVVAIACGIFGLLMIGTPEDDEEDEY